MAGLRDFLILDLAPPRKGGAFRASRELPRNSPAHVSGIVQTAMNGLLFFSAMANSRRGCMNDNSAPTESRVSKARAEVTIDASCITNEELERDDIPKAENSKSTVLREPSDLPSSSRMLVLVAAVAGLVTLVWFAFLVWLVLKALSLL